MTNTMDNDFFEVDEVKLNSTESSYLVASLKTGITRGNKVEQTSFFDGVIADILKKEGFKKENWIEFLSQNKKDLSQDIKLIDQFKIRWSILMYVNMINDEKILIVVNPINKYEKVK